MSIRVLSVLVLLAVTLQSVSAVNATIKFRYDPTQAYRNPFRGFARWYNDVLANSSVPWSMEYISLPMNSVMTGPANFTWDKLDSMLQTALYRGSHGIVRFYVDYPGSPSGMPDFLKNGTNPVTCTPYSDYGGGCSPDYTNSRLIDAMVSFIEAFGARFDWDYRVAYVQLGLLGYWGEWHTYPNTQLFATRGVQSRILFAFDQSFNRTKLMVSQDEMQYWSLTDTAYPPTSVYDIGYHDDAFGESTYSATQGQNYFFYDRLVAHNISNRWMGDIYSYWSPNQGAIPIAGEILPSYQSTVFATSGYQGQPFVPAVNATHASWLLTDYQFTDTNPFSVQKALTSSLALGYQFFLKQVDASAPSDCWMSSYRCSNQACMCSSLDITIVNNGAAPFPYDLSLAIVANDGGYYGFPYYYQTNSAGLGSSLTITVQVAWILPNNNTLTNGNFSFSLFSGASLWSAPHIKFANAENDPSGIIYVMVPASAGTFIPQSDPYPPYYPDSSSSTGGGWWPWESSTGGGWWPWESSTGGYDPWAPSSTGGWWPYDSSSSGGSYPYGSSTGGDGGSSSGGYNPYGSSSSTGPASGSSSTGGYNPYGSSSSTGAAARSSSTAGPRSSSSTAGARSSSTAGARSSSTASARSSSTAAPAASSSTGSTPPSSSTASPASSSTSSVVASSSSTADQASSTASTPSSSTGAAPPSSTAGDQTGATGSSDSSSAGTTGSSSDSSSAGTTGGDSGSSTGAAGSSGAAASSSSGAAAPSSTGGVAPTPVAPVSVVFKLSYDYNSLPTGTVDSFMAALKHDIAVALGVPESVIVIVSVAAGSVTVQVQFVAAPDGVTAPAPSVLANEFISQSNTPSSPLYSQPTSAATVQNSASIVNVTPASGGDDDNGSGLNQKVGGVRAYIILIIALAALCILVIVFVVCRNMCAQKKLTIDQRMMGRNTDSVENELGHLSNMAGQATLESTREAHRFDQI